MVEMSSIFNPTALAYRPVATAHSPSYGEEQVCRTCNGCILAAPGRECQKQVLETPSRLSMCCVLCFKQGLLWYTDNPVVVTTW
jgi:hypothetical protein